jgi:hypothetical protein
LTGRKHWKTRSKLQAKLRRLPGGWFGSRHVLGSGHKRLDVQAEPGLATKGGKQLLGSPGVQPHSSGPALAVFNAGCRELDESFQKVSQFAPAAGRVPE